MPQKNAVAGRKKFNRMGVKELELGTLFDGVYAGLQKFIHNLRGDFDHLLSGWSFIERDDLPQFVGRIIFIIDRHKLLDNSVNIKNGFQFVLFFRGRLRLRRSRRGFPGLIRAHPAREKKETRGQKRRAH